MHVLDSPALFLQESPSYHVFLTHLLFQRSWKPPSLVFRHHHDLDSIDFVIIYCLEGQRVFFLASSLADEGLWGRIVDSKDKKDARMKQRAFLSFLLRSFVSLIFVFFSSALQSILCCSRSSFVPLFLSREVLLTKRTTRSEEEGIDERSSLLLREQSRQIFIVRFNHEHWELRRECCLSFSQPRSGLLVFSLDERFKILDSRLRSPLSSASLPNTVQEYSLGTQ